MDMILIVNAGSSSLKCSLFDIVEGDVRQHYRVKVANLAGPARLEIRDHLEDPDGVLVDREELSVEQLDVIHGNAHAQALKVVLEWLKVHLPQSRIVRVGHRVVHGGDRYSEPVQVDDEVLSYLKTLIPLAPLHQPYNVRLIELCREALSHDIPQIACFDTAFHATIPDVAQHYALPRRLTEAGVRRYGFHGLSYEYIHDKLSRLDADLSERKLVVAHLGAGSSMCAIQGGKSQASTMGFTAVEGLPMGSRSGQLDPGVLLYLMREHDMGVDDIEHMLYKECGWLGVSGISSDMMTLKKSDDPHAREAIEMYAYRIGQFTAAMAAALSGIEVFVFTGGVGENDADLRARVAELNGWLGMKLDSARNHSDEYLISADDSAIKVFAIPTNEEKMIARHVLRLTA